MPGERKGVTTFERSELENGTDIGEAPEKLLNPSIIDYLIITTSWHPFDDKMRDPWATPCGFSNQVHSH